MLSYLLTFIFCLVASAILLLTLKYTLPASFLSAGFNARSNHTTPARQIGGLACIPVCVCALLIVTMTGMIPARLGISLSIAALLVWVAGYIDDRKELSVRARLPVQVLASIIAIYGLGENFRLLPQLLPYWLEAMLLCVALLGSINVTNFMDGLDWLTASGLGIPLFLLGLVSACLLQDPALAVLAFAASGAVAGFAVFNRPPALIFLGDSGSLPLGLIAGVAFLLFARNAAIIPALILPLYYIADSSSTILLRLRKGENILQAHSAHAYQIAKRSGKSVYYVTGYIALLNVCLGTITALVILSGTVAGQLIGMALASALTGLLIRHFRHR
ncbi:putative undecaprenyl-phosphate N-acetylglucosaminyl 1-phosphate transferase [Pseudochrobactrum sp. MP213Fo]